MTRPSGGNSEYLIGRSSGLLAGARSSPELAAEVSQAIDRAIAYATEELSAVVGASPFGELLPTPVIAELAAAAFLGLEVLAQGGRQIDWDQLALTIATVVPVATALGQGP